MTVNRLAQRYGLDIQKPDLGPLRALWTKDPEPLRRVMLVEGPRDEEMFNAVARDMKVDSTVVFVGVGGITRVTKGASALKQLWLRPEFRGPLRVGVLLDSGDDRQEVERLARDALAQFELFIGERGIIAKSGDISGGYYLVPEEGCGGIESVCWTSVSGAPPGVAVDKFLRAGWALLDPNPEETPERRIKRFCTAYISAFSPVPAVAYGIAAANGVWDLQHESFRGLREFIGRFCDS